LGFKTGVKGCVLFDLKSRELFLSRDVVFFESIFPYHISTSNNDKSQTHLNHNSYDIYDDDFLDHQATTNPSSTSCSDPIFNNNSPISNNSSHPSLNIPHHDTSLPVPHQDTATPQTIPENNT
jgi:hypothetical protein